MKRCLALFCLIAFLYGCGAAQLTVSATPLPVVAPDTKVNVPPEILAKCPPVKSLPVRKYSQGESLITVQTWQDMYTACANKQSKLSDLTAKAFNIQEAPTPASTVIIP